MKNVISHHRVIDWMNVIRENPDNYRILENFWASQLNSKAWLVNILHTYGWGCWFPPGNVYIFGGWYGILAQMIVDNFPNVNVISIDKDPQCIEMGKKLSNDDSRITFVCDDMETYSSYYVPSLIINTSTEHVSQEVFDSWLVNVPVHIPVILQGNDYFSCIEHVRCFPTLQEFTTHNPLSYTLFSGSLDCTQFTRYMSLGYK
jgi:hypothetical protein